MYSFQSQNLDQALVLPEIGMHLSEAEAMDLALRVALQGGLDVGLNPHVGVCLVDRHHRFLGCAAHLCFGEAHAEALLIKQLKIEGRIQQAQGGILYSTLEPCTHFGRNPPCADQVKTLDLSKVVVAALDNNPLVETNRGVLKDQIYQDPKFSEICEWINTPYLHWSQQKKPFIGLKAGMSLDGKFALKESKQYWLTNNRAREYAHFLRGFYQGVVIGAETLIVDDPQLSIRTGYYKGGASPWRIILDPQLRGLQSRDAHRIIELEPEKVIWCYSEDLDLPKLHPGFEQVQFVALPSINGVFNLEDLLKLAVQNQIRSLLLEGGLGVWKSFADAGLIDRIHLLQTSEALGEKGRGFLTAIFSQFKPSKKRISLLEDNLLLEFER